jgi:hypothetical protein
MILADFHLPPLARRTVAHVATVTCPTEIERLGLVDHVVDGFELALRSFSAPFRHSLIAGLTAFELGAALRYGRPFSSLAPEPARAWFASWWSSPFSLFRQLAKAVKSLLALTFYESPPIRERLEFHPDRWIAEAARARLEHYGVDIERAEDDVRAPDPLVPLSPRRRQHA